VYGVEAKPLDTSVEAVHVHVGVVLLEEDAVVGVPGVVGPVPSK